MGHQPKLPMNSDKLLNKEFIFADDMNVPDKFKGGNRFNCHIDNDGNLSIIDVYDNKTMHKHKFGKMGSISIFQNMTEVSGNYNNKGELKDIYVVKLDNGDTLRIIDVTRNPNTPNEKNGQSKGYFLGDGTAFITGRLRYTPWKVNRARTKIFAIIVNGTKSPYNIRFVNSDPIDDVSLTDPDRGTYHLITCNFTAKAIIKTSYGFIFIDNEDNIIEVFGVTSNIKPSGLNGVESLRSNIKKTIGCDLSIDAKTSEFDDKKFIIAGEANSITHDGIVSIKRKFDHTDVGTDYSIEFFHVINPTTPPTPIFTTSQINDSIRTEDGYLVIDVDYTIIELLDITDSYDSIVNAGKNLYTMDYQVSGLVSEATIMNDGEIVYSIDKLYVLGDQACPSEYSCLKEEIFHVYLHNTKPLYGSDIITFVDSNSKECILVTGFINSIQNNPDGSHTIHMCSGYSVTVTEFSKSKLESKLNWFNDKVFMLGNEHPNTYNPMSGHPIVAEMQRVFYGVNNYQYFINLRDQETENLTCTNNLTDITIAPGGEYAIIYEDSGDVTELLNITNRPEDIQKLGEHPKERDEVAAEAKGIFDSKKFAFSLLFDGKKFILCSEFKKAFCELNKQVFAVQVRCKSDCCWIEFIGVDTGGVIDTITVAYKDIVKSEYGYDIVDCNDRMFRLLDVTEYCNNHTEIDVDKIRYEFNHGGIISKDILRTEAPLNYYESRVLMFTGCYDGQRCIDYENMKGSLIQLRENSGKVRIVDYPYEQLLGHSAVESVSVSDSGKVIIITSTHKLECIDVTDYVNYAKLYKNASYPTNASDLIGLITRRDNEVITNPRSEGMFDPARCSFSYKRQQRYFFTFDEKITQGQFIEFLKINGYITATNPRWSVYRHNKNEYAWLYELESEGGSEE